MRHAAPRPKNFRKFLANSFEGICGLPPVCRPAGWVALWRRMGNLSVLDCGLGG
jgi:hypothetical protein